VSDTTTDFFDGIGSGAGAPSAVLANPGDYVQGEIVEMFKRDYVPYGKTEPEKREDGSTKQQLVILLQTELRNWANVSKIPRVDPSDKDSAEKPPSDDDGKRAVYVPEGKNIQFAIGRAVAASQSKFEVGGKLGVKVDNLRDTGKGNPLKEHKAVYTPKPAESAGDGFFGDAPKTESAPAASAPSTPAPAASTPPADAGDPWATSPSTDEPPF